MHGIEQLHIAFLFNFTWLSRSYCCLTYPQIDSLSCLSVSFREVESVPFVAMSLIHVSRSVSSLGVLCIVR